MKSRLLNLSLLASVVAGGVAISAQSAQAITLNAGDRLDIAGELIVTDGTFFDFQQPAAATTPDTEFVVTGATGGFTPFEAFANSGDYSITDLDIDVSNSQFDADGSDLPNNPNNLLTLEEFNPSCLSGQCQAFAPEMPPLNFITMEIGDMPGTDLIIELTEINFLSAFDLGPGNTQTSASGLFNYITSSGELAGSGSFNATFVGGSDQSSYSATFTVEEQPIPEPSSLAALAAMAGIGALSLKKKSKNS